MVSVIAQTNFSPKKLESWVPINRITQPSTGEYYWFGYYDKMEYSPDGRYVLDMKTPFQVRSPTKNDMIEIGMVDLNASNQWIKLGTSSAWNWQQGCMLQWLPESTDKVLWNDRNEKGFICKIMNIKSRELKVLDNPVYAVSPDGKTGIFTDFRRIQDMHPGYGYPGFKDPNCLNKVPKGSGVWKMDLTTGESELILSIEEVTHLHSPNYEFIDSKHYFNHLLFNPDGSRFVLLHRWRTGQSLTNPADTPFGTRMVTADLNGENISVIDDFGYTSHFIWKDKNHVLAWARQEELGDKFYLFEDELVINRKQLALPDSMTRNGHCTYLPNTDWILNDTYPDENRLQEIYLFHVPSGKKYSLAKVYLPAHYKFDSELRIDTHPRISPDGTKVVIDSWHEGLGRQLYLLDISEILSSQ